MNIQIEEIINVDGIEYLLVSRPINYLLKKIEPKFEYNPLEVPKDKEYSASWFIKNNILYLKEIEFTNGFKYIEEVNQVLFKNKNLVADLFNGILIAYGGEPVWFRKGVDPVYEKELIFKIENGVVVNHEVIENGLPF